MTQIEIEVGEQSPTRHYCFDIPPSVNKMYRRTRWSVVLTNDAMAYKEYAGIVAMQQCKKKPLICTLAVTYHFYGSRLDADNGIKLLNDALNGIAWRDDRQILEMHVYVNRNKTPNPRVEVEVKPL